MKKYLFLYPYKRPLRHLLIFKKISPPVSKLNYHSETYNENRVLKVYAINYNVLRFNNGLGTLDYIII